MLRGQGRKQAQLDLSSSDFDGIINVGSDSCTLASGAVFRGLLQCSPDTEITITFPTAAQLIAASPILPCQGFCKRFSIRNDGTSAVTIVAGDGGSINGSSTVPASSYASHYVLRFTSVTSGVESYQIIHE